MPYSDILLRGCAVPMCAARNISADFAAGQKRQPISPWWRLVWRALEGIRSAWPQSILFRPCMILSRMRCMRQCLTVTPRHPCRPIGSQFWRVPLQLGQIVKRVDARELTGMDQAHEQISQLSAVKRLIKQRVLAVEHSALQCLFTDVVVQRSAGLA